MIECCFEGEIIWWRGPSPFHFIAIPLEESELIADVAAEVTYGWGVIPVRAAIGATSYTTSLFPKNGGYLLPVKAAVRRSEALEIGSRVVVSMCVGQ